MFKSALVVLFGLFFGPLTVCGQDYNVPYTDQPVVIDGLLDEEIWQTATRAGNFQQYFPLDDQPAEAGTEIMFAYDDKNFYFAARMENLDTARDYVIPSLRRDFRGNNDVITLSIDPFLDKSNSFFFGISPFGVQREGLVANGGQRRSALNLSWDNIWWAEATQHEGYWIAEAAIPFKTLRFKKDSEQWNINVYRIDTEKGERSTWTPIPRSMLILNLAFMKQVQFEAPLEKNGPNISLIPYVSGNSNWNYDEPGTENPQVEGNAGFDAKIAVTPSLNLDLTVNPDFSQVEVDEQVTNLNRFELFFPERRQFFLENEDLFSSSGHPFLARPFFSRRIGVARDTVTGVNVQNTIHYGARLSGKLDNNWRLGVLNMQEAKIAELGKPTTNYTVGVVQRKVFARSNITGIFVNKTPIISSLEGDSLTTSFNRIAGLDYNIQSADGKWSGKVFYHHSFDEEMDPKQYSHAAWLSYNSNTWLFSWAHVAVGKNYDAEVGYVPRKGIFRINPDIGYNFLPRSGFFNQHTIRLGYEAFYNPDRQTDETISLEYTAALINTGRLSAELRRDYTYLLNDFDPTNTDGPVLPADSDYSYAGISFEFNSDTRKLFSYGLEGYAGEYFNGDRYSLGASINYRFQPYVAIELNTMYNRILMPGELNDADLVLIGSRFDFTFTRNVFLTSFLQYNNQIENLNINTRFQWRFKPVSDLFIVYTDNYGTSDIHELGLTKRNRALIAKLTYWFNL